MTANIKFNNKLRCIHMTLRICWFLLTLKFVLHYCLFRNMKTYIRILLVLLLVSAFVTNMYYVSIYRKSQPVPGDYGSSSNVIHRYDVWRTMKNIATSSHHSHIDARVDNKLNKTTGFNIPNIIIKEPTRLNYLLHNPHKCSSQRSRSAIVFVSSAVHNVHHRRLIRDTWGAVTHMEPYSVRTVFMLGFTYNNTLQAQIVKESHSNKDIIQGSFVDSYRNMTYKHLMALGWISDFCPNSNVIIKVDDDMYINMTQLRTYLLEVYDTTPRIKYMYCVLHVRGPTRDVTNKHFVSQEEVSATVYPPFCKGNAYIMSPDLPVSMYLASREIRILWIDDVYVTGMLARQVGVNHHLMKPPFHVFIRGRGNLEEPRNAMFVSYEGIIPNQQLQQRINKW